jgi:hypothetical protein
MLRRIPRLLCLAVALLAVSGGTLRAQREFPIALGSRVRVKPQGETTWHVGRLAGVGADTIRLRSCNSCAVDVYSLRSLSAVQVSVGRSARGNTILKGTLLGLLAGLVSGWIYAELQTSKCRGEDLCGLEYLWVPYLGAGGLVVGTLIGASFRYDDWRPASIP